jgi:hypothetical protein
VSPPVIHQATQLPLHLFKYISLDSAAGLVLSKGIRAGMRLGVSLLVFIIRLLTWIVSDEDGYYGDARTHLVPLKPSRP